MKFKLTARNKGDKSGYTWEEEYEKDVKDPEKWSRKLIDNYNATLMDGEEIRELLKVEIIDTTSVSGHTWKKTSLVGEMYQGSIIDRYACTVCGITGKRFGFGGVQFDPKYKAKVYQRCDTAKAHIDKKQAKEHPPIRRMRRTKFPGDN